ncbi:MAG: ABC transporter substrate-binding protein [Ruminococcus sp.]|nr:ABC transporter substrate-binding protein [Ruminococcus sp.]MCM1381223.1 ABC transporter substrate-binding protein [Muribaculaceae bacterium]MCM1478805.1 ABC transporter substrate-binding protein [Muribaculaceae bacterium]
MKKSAFFTAAALSLSLTACSDGNGGSSADGGNSSAAAVRFLNFKPEIATAYEEIAAKYKEETGNTVIVETAANNTYEQTLSAKMATNEAPTIFQVNGPRGYANWKDYCADLTSTELYAHLTDKSAALTYDGGVYGIPFMVEGYGIIYNKEITDKYFELADKAVDFGGMEDVNNFDKLKTLVEDMQSKKETLGINGVFASTSLKPGDDWRWQTHLANLPVYYEFQKNNTDLTSDAVKEITFEFGDNFKNIFDLYINNSTVDRKLLGSKITDESMAEFALGECAMVQNGNWAWSQINGINGNKVTADNIKYLPIYTGVQGEENQGLCIGTENFLCINSQASEAAQTAAADFLYWLVSSESGKKYVVDSLGFIAPFDTFADAEKPDDPLTHEILNWTENGDVSNIPWNFTLFPSQTFKDDFGAALLQYAQGSIDWDEVKNTVVNSWKTESSHLE